MILEFPPPLYPNSAQVITHQYLLFSSLIQHTTRELNLMFIVQNNQSFRSYRALYTSVSPTQPPTHTDSNTLTTRYEAPRKTLSHFPKYFESSDVQPSSLTVDILLEKVEKLQGSDKKLHLLSLLRKIRS